MKKYLTFTQLYYSRRFSLDLFAQSNSESVPSAMAGDGFSPISTLLIISGVIFGSDCLLVGF